MKSSKVAISSAIALIIVCAVIVAGVGGAIAGRYVVPQTISTSISTITNTIASISTSTSFSTATSVSTVTLPPTTTISINTITNTATSVSTATSISTVTSTVSQSSTTTAYSTITQVSTTTVQPSGSMVEANNLQVTAVGSGSLIVNFTAQYVGYAVVSVTPNTAPNSGWYIEAGNFEGSGCQGYSGTGSGSSGVTLQELILYSGYPCHWEYYSFSGYLNVPVLPGTASFYFGNTNSGSATDAFTVTYYYR